MISLENASHGDLDASCLPAEKVCLAPQIKQIRVRDKASQEVFSEFLNIRKSSIQKGGQGQEKALWLFY